MWPVCPETHSECITSISVPISNQNCTGEKKKIKYSAYLPPKWNGGLGCTQNPR